uniref:Venom nuclease-like protein 1 n=1 Tax=Pristhesancus plagipennis TaxID=1955184 RepID=A0A1Q1NPA1_PRIPG|nr:venom nuclease-like protein 1 [Pristhesancus plagipennis]
MIGCTQFLVLLLWIGGTYVKGVPHPGCVLYTNKDLPKKNEPLFLAKHEGKEYRLVMPETKGKEGFIHLKSGQELVMTCPGGRNYMNETKKEINHAHCKSGRLLKIQNRDYESEVLDCFGRVSAVVRKTENKCHKGQGTVLELGFKAEGWHPLVKVCHDIRGARTFYSHHTLYGSVLPGKVHRSTGRPGFSRGEKFLYEGYSPDRAYNRKNQLKVFHSVIGEKKTSHYIDEKNKFLSRGHLAPDADFLFSTWQLLTYFFINVAPQWQSINAGNWLNVETNTRRIASKLGADLEVITGTNGVSKMKDSEGNLKEIYLHANSKIPVPEYYWKLLHNPKDDSCMGFITTNNPYLDESPNHKCKDVCSNYGWPVMQKDLFKGYVYCCEYSTMKKAIPELPDVTCKKPLSF